MKLHALLMCLITLSCSPLKHNKPLSYLSGNWFNKIYLKTLIETRSPKAANSAYIAYVQITDNYIGRIYNFHESAGRETDSLISTNTRNIYTLNHYPSDTIQQIDNDNIIWKYNAGYGDIDNIDLVRIREPISTFINKVVVCGKYIDSIGNSYNFQETGSVFWVDSTFKYSICLDLTFTDKDCMRLSLLDDSKVRLYGFSVDKNKLMLYRELIKEHNDEGVFFESTPFLILTKQ
ncbi:MAG: hypothetical protein Q7U71_02435 [bacterium]|nr:hypothetical protein [bacterium]